MVATNREFGLYKHSSKNSLNVISNYNSNQALGTGINPDNIIFKTTSSNFQISDITLSNAKDFTRTNGGY
jgi:hypothetical protein